MVFLQKTSVFERYKSNILRKKVFSVIKKMASKKTRNVDGLRRGMCALERMLVSFFEPPNDNFDHENEENTSTEFWKQSTLSSEFDAGVSGQDFRENASKHSQHRPASMGTGRFSTWKKISGGGKIFPFGSPPPHDTLPASQGLHQVQLCLLCVILIVLHEMRHSGP